MNPVLQGRNLPERMVEFDDVWHHYAMKATLRGVSFKANAGELTCVMGENGVGKSTLLRIVAGLAGGALLVVVLTPLSAAWTFFAASVASAALISRHLERRLRLVGGDEVLERVAPKPTWGGGLAQQLKLGLGPDTEPSTSLRLRLLAVPALALLTAGFAARVELGDVHPLRVDEPKVVLGIGIAALLVPVVRFGCGAFLATHAHPLWLRLVTIFRGSQAKRFGWRADDACLTLLGAVAVGAVAALLIVPVSRLLGDIAAVALFAAAVAAANLLPPPSFAAIRLTGEGSTSHHLPKGSSGLQRSARIQLRDRAQRGEGLRHLRAAARR